MDASIKSSELQSDLTSGRSPLVIDVRKSPAFHAASDMIAGALRRDPSRVSAWVKERIFSDDHEMLKHGMVMYDALYAWCKGGQDELHTWNPAAYR